MYKNISELFEKEKLKIMVNVEDSNIICFPNRENPQLICDINSPLALGCATVLKAGFNIHGIEFKKHNDNELSILFNGEEIQKFHFLFIDESVDKTINSISLNSEKTTVVVFDKDIVFEQEQPLSSYLNYFSKYSPESGLTKSVRELRRESIKESGMYIEEYEGNHTILKGSDILDSIKMSHYNTFSNPIVMKVENLDDIQKQLLEIQKFGNVDKTIEIQSNISSVRNIPLESFNSIFNVSNYRDLDMQEVVENKIEPFFNTLLSQAIKHYELKSEYSDAELDNENNLVKRSILSSIQKNLEVQGNSKKLYSLSPNKNILSEGKIENKVYINEKDVCINSKGTCLGNGQHSTTTFNLLYLLLNQGEHAKFEIFEKLNCSNITISKLFKVSNNNPFAIIQKKLFEKIEENNLSVNQFLDFFNKMKINISWDIVSDISTLSNKVKNDNAQKEQNKTDNWINENKEYITKFIARYKQVNASIISEYKENGISLDINGVKTPDNSPGASLETLNPVKLNDIYPYLSFVLPNDKNFTPIDKPYTLEHSDKTKDSSMNCRNIYQEEVFSEKLSNFWSDIFHKKFRMPGNDDTFAEFISMMTEESKLKIKNQLKVDNFLTIGYTALNNNENFKKIPAIIIYKDLTEKLFAQIKDSLDQNFKNAISSENFTKLAFFTFVSKIGKNNFNVENVELYGKVILKEIANSFYDYYSNDKDLIKSTDKWKRMAVKDFNKLSEEAQDLIHNFMIDLFEPYQDQQKFQNSFCYANTGKTNWKNVIQERTNNIEAEFIERFGHNQINIREKKSKLKNI